MTTTLGATQRDPTRKSRISAICYIEIAVSKLSYGFQRTLRYDFLLEIPLRGFPFQMNSSEK